MEKMLEMPLAGPGGDLSTGHRDAGAALIVFDPQLRVVLRNAEAEAMAEQGIVSLDAGAHIRGDLARVLRRRLERGDDGAPLLLRAPDGGDFYLCALVASATRATAGQTLFALIIRDVRAELRERALAVARRNRLTVRETRMLMLIVEGYDPSGAARRLGVARSTARTHLQRVFEKIGVTRQGELVSFVARFVGGEARSA